MIHCKRLEWVWSNRPSPQGELRQRRYETQVSAGNGQLAILKDRDHIAGDPPPNAAVPEARRIILFRMPELKPVRDGWSDIQGSITFTCLDQTSTYMAYSPGYYVGNSRFDAVCTDNLVPELMA